jgi:hypothetical protein
VAVSAASSRRRTVAVLAVRDLIHHSSWRAG